MSLLNPATAYRRSTSRPRIPVVLPQVQVTVDDTGTLSVSIDDEPPTDDTSGLTRGDLRPLLDRIATERESALRVEIHEPDGTVFTDFHTPQPAATPAPVPPPSIRETHGRAGAQPTVRVSAGTVTGEGFGPSETVVMAIVVHRTTATADGTLDLHLPVALLDRTNEDVVLLGEQTGLAPTRSDATEASEREAS
ncbi:hypothetical protein [Nocardioides daejeonensis]|jgi:hypothetical protein|uniref:hypothetical protein n=1 Tax=Nocardioides daejeonensis TaxID=1046556 RepID=UPI000D74F26D|nr:hypothetical protein [Nocardioides daejeonensis]